MRDEAISVVQTGHSDPMQFQVTASSTSATTIHIITLSNAQFARLSRGMIDPELLIEAGIRFLLDRVPKERIMERFDLPAIGQYFPEFELNLPTYLANSDCHFPEWDTRVAMDSGAAVRIPTDLAVTPGSSLQRSR